MVDKVAKLPKKWELLWKPAERRNKREITLKKAKEKKITETEANSERQSSEMYMSWNTFL